MMTCQQVLDLLSPFLEEEVSADLRADIEKHLKHCRRCSVLHDSMRKLLIIAGDERTFEIPAGYSERLHAFLDRFLSQPDSAKPS